MKEGRWYGDNPKAELDRLGVATICKRLGWSERKTLAEMNRVASAEAFLVRIRRAIEAGDKPRLLARSARMTNAPEDSDAARGYTDRPFLADLGAGEAVPAAFQAKITAESRERDALREREEIEAVLAQRKASLDHRLATLQHIARVQPQRAKELRSLERLIERKLQEIERRALRDAA